MRVHHSIRSCRCSHVRHDDLASSHRVLLFLSAFNRLGLLMCRYERSKDRTQRGSSVVQRHVAMQDEVDIAEGKGRLVSGSMLVPYFDQGSRA